MPVFESDEGEILQTRVPGFNFTTESEDLLQTFYNELANCQEVYIAVDYASAGSLDKMERLAKQNGLEKIVILLGMDFNASIPKELYQKAQDLNRRWMKQNLGEIRLVTCFKNHDKTYLFKKEGRPVSAISGSPSLAFIDDDPEISRRFDSATLYKDEENLLRMEDYMDFLQKEENSINLEEISPEEFFSRPWTYYV